MHNSTDLDRINWQASRLYTVFGYTKGLGVGPIRNEVMGTKFSGPSPAGTGPDIVFYTWLHHILG